MTTPAAAPQLFPCPRCGKAFKTKGGLSTHKYFVHDGGNARESICQVCEEIFDSPSALARHHRFVHPKERVEITQTAEGEVETKKKKRLHLVPSVEVEAISQAAWIDVQKQLADSAAKMKQLRQDKSTVEKELRLRDAVIAGHEAKVRRLEAELNEARLNTAVTVSAQLGGVWWLQDLDREFYRSVGNIVSLVGSEGKGEKLGKIIEILGDEESVELFKLIYENEIARRKRLEGSGS